MSKTKFITYEQLMDQVLGIDSYITEAQGSDSDADKYKELIDRIISKCNEIVSRGKGSSEDDEDNYFAAKYFIGTMATYKHYESYIRDGRKVFMNKEAAMKALKRLQQPKEIERDVHALSLILAKHSE